MTAAVLTAAWTFVALVCIAVAAEKLRATWSVLAIGKPRVRLPLIERWRRSVADERADRELPNVIEHIARALRAGSNLVSAIRAAAPASPPRLAREWSTLSAVAADRGVAEAARRWRQHRAESPSVRLASAALALAADVGGPQARALDAVASTLRERLALAAEVRAITAQARASAMVIGAAPVGFAVIASGLEPSYLPFLVRSPAGWFCLSSGLALDAAGLAWMRRITRTAS